MEQPAAEQEKGGEDRAAIALFNVRCAGCHGREGRGQGPQLPRGASAPDLTGAGWQASRTDQQIIDTLEHGRGAMPGIGGQLGATGIEALVRRVRDLKATEPTKATESLQATKSLKRPSRETVGNKTATPTAAKSEPPSARPPEPR